MSENAGSKSRDMWIVWDFAGKILATELMQKRKFLILWWTGGHGVTKQIENNLEQATLLNS
jgi:hypothetical protein